MDDRYGLLLEVLDELRRQNDELIAERDALRARVPLIYIAIPDDEPAV